MRQTVADVSGKYLWITLPAKHILTKNTEVLQFYGAKGVLGLVFHLGFFDTSRCKFGKENSEII